MTFLLARLALAGFFAFFTYTGAGGDTAMYQLLGGYLRDLVVDPDNASLMVRMDRQQFFAVEEGYYRLAVIVQQVYDGNLETIFGETGLSIVAIHAALYMLWDSPFVVILVQCVLNAFAYAVFIRSNGLGSATGLLKWNPASLYFAATLYKESFTETALLLLAARTRGKMWLAKIPVLLFMAFLRPEFLFFAAVIFVVFRMNWLRAVAWPKLIAALLFLFLVMPAAYADWMIAADSAGAIYSLVYANEFTRRVLGPILGMLLPMPFMLVPFSSFWGVLYNVYGLFYYWLMIRIIRLDLRALRFRGNAYLNAGLIVLALISYRFTGQSGTKDRYFAPFLPFLVVGYCLKREEYERLQGGPGAAGGGLAVETAEKRPST